MTTGQGSLVAGLDQVARLIESAGVGRCAADDRRRAQQLALALDDHGSGVSEAGSVQLVFAAALLGDLAVDLVAEMPTAARLLKDLEQIAGLSGTALGREVLRGSHLSQLPVDVALHVQLSLLLLFTRAGSVSLWTRPEGENARSLSQIGDFGPEPEPVEHAANQLLERDGRDRVASGRNCTGRLVQRGQLSPAAVVVNGAANENDRSDLLLEAAAPQIAAILDRTELLAAGGAENSSTISALERRLARLRFDLHDGPQQDVHLLALDLRLFRDQLGSVLKGHPNADRLMGRLDDLEAQLVALDSELRQISTSMQSPFLPAGSLPEALEEIASAFTARTAIRPEVELSGNFSQLSDSQQITLLALIREALNNVQKHSQAKRVTITIAAHSRGVDAQVVDDGRGFDPEQTLVQAAREGHLGVVGIHERVRMLGGDARIESRPGGPTVISVAIPSWAPAQAGQGFIGAR
jgi:signal transduction histidine kinase